MFATVLKDVRSADAMAALQRSQAVIEFAPDGTILAANPNFLGVMGYTRDEVIGRHHGMFVDPHERDAAEYRAFWDALRRGEAQIRSFRRTRGPCAPSTSMGRSRRFTGRRR